MANHKIFTGARAILKINNKSIGIFSRVSYSVNYDAAPAYILGRYSAAEITYTSAEIVSIDAVGFRIIDNGPHAYLSVPKLQDLLNHSSISIDIIDRRTVKEKNPTVLKVYHVRPLGFATEISARGQVEISVRFVGIRAEDESGSQSEVAEANDLP